MVLLQRRSSIKTSAHSSKPICGDGAQSKYLLRSSNTPTFHDWRSQGSDQQARGQSLGTNTGRKTQPISDSRGFLSGAAVLLLLPWVLALASDFHLRTAQKEVDALFLSISMANRDLLQSTEKVTRLDRQSRNLIRENDSALRDLRYYGVGYVHDTNDIDYQNLEQKEEVLLERIDMLEAQVQRDNRKLIEENYGKGPHLVEFKLSSPIGDARDRKFVVELAPIALMPHTVHHFLRMVSSKLWDGLALVHQDHSSHKVQAIPINARTTQRADDRFEKSGLTKLAFAELHVNYPCLPYSLGFTGALGGSGFFISTDHDQHDEGESCFGLIVEGMDIIGRFMESRGNGNVGVEAIESVRLVQQAIPDEI